MKIHLKIDEKLKTIIRLVKKLFTAEKFILGLSKINIAKKMSKIRRLFKPYFPVIKKDFGGYNFKVKGGAQDDVSSLTDSKFMENMYMSNIFFFNDIIEITKIVDHKKPVKDKKKEILEYLNQINKNFPSFVYIPSGDSKLKRMIIMRIEYTETKLFCTKSKTNFTIWLQMISPEEYLMRNFYAYKEKREKFILDKMKHIDDIENKKVATPAMLLSQTNISTQLITMQNDEMNFVGGDSRDDEKAAGDKLNITESNRRLYQSGHSDGLNESRENSMVCPQSNRRLSAGAKLNTNSESSIPSRKNTDANDKENEEAAKVGESLDDLFGTNTYKQLYRIKVNSLYSGYSSFTVKNYVVKVGDDVRQEYFAMQIINEFQTIFKLKKLKLILTPYEIIPMGPKA